jgi:hypothetical protein
VVLKSQEGDSWFDRRVSPSFLLITGLLLAPSIILQHNLVVKSVQTLVFLGFALLSVSTGKHRLVVGSCILIATTIIVNLFSPVGQLIVRIGPLRITLGALRLGISKATTLASLLYVSRFCVRPTVRLPGVLGRYVAETFSYLNKLVAGGKRLNRHNLVQSLDAHFERIFKGGRSGHNASEVDEVRKVNTPVGVLLLVLLLITNWGAVFFSFSGLLAEL